MTVKCKNCGHGPGSRNNKGAYLGRVNKLGVPGIWECKPHCFYNHKDVVGAILCAIKDIK